MITDPFRSGCQHHWVKRCLVNYPCRPNICNLDQHIQREGQGCLWPKTDKDGQPLRLCKDDVLYKLRWVTLGYHYNWSTKVCAVNAVSATPIIITSCVALQEYCDDKRSRFPEDLAQLSSFLLKIAGFSKYTLSLPPSLPLPPLSLSLLLSLPSPPLSLSLLLSLSLHPSHMQTLLYFPRFSAEAAIVNYYHLDSTLSGHTDHSERDLSHPLLSIRLSGKYRNLSAM